MASVPASAEVVGRLLASPELSVWLKTLRGVVGGCLMAASSPRLAGRPISS